MITGTNKPNTGTNNKIIAHFSNLDLGIVKNGTLLFLNIIGYAFADPPNAKDQPD